MGLGAIVILVVLVVVAVLAAAGYLLDRTAEPQHVDSPQVKT